MADQEIKLRYQVEIMKSGTGAQQAAQEFDRLDGSARRAEAGVLKMAAGIGTAAKAFFALQVVQGVINFMGEAITEFENAEKAAKQLDGTLRALGRYTPELSGYLRQLANDLEASTKVDDSEILGAISTLLRMGATAEEIGPMVQRALDISADGATSLAAAAEALGRAMQGEFGSMGRILGMRFDEQAGRAENFARAIGLVDERFQGMAKATAASDNSLKSLKKEWGELKETFGELITEFITPLVRGINSALKGMRDLFDTMRGRSTPAPLLPGAVPAGGGSGGREAVDLTKAQREMAELVALQRVRAAERAASGRAMFSGQGDEFGELVRANDARVAKLAEQESKGIIDKANYERAILQIEQQFQMERAALVLRGKEMEQQVRLELVSSSLAQQIQIRQQHEETLQAIASRYDAEKQMAEVAGQDTSRIEAEKQEAIRRTNQASQEAQWRISETGSLLIDIGQRGTQAFTGGLASAMVNAARTGKAAFGEFFSSFFAQMAQAIAQALMLRAISGILGGMGVSPGTIQALGLPAFNANGGFNPRMAAVGAVLGTSIVSGATYFPQFNAVAGEAGSEVMAVLSKPRFMQIGGLQSYVGSVAGSELAMTNARDLRSAVSGQRSGVGGEIVVVVRGTKDFEARVVDSSIEGALVRVHNEVLTDTGLRSAIKEVGA